MKRVLHAVLGVVLLAVLLPAADAAAPHPCPGSPQGAPDATFSGTFDTTLEGAYVMVPFVVPEGQTRLRVRLCHDQPPTPLSSQLKHTLDMGLYDRRSPVGSFGPDGFRGWGGSSRPDVLINPRGNDLGGPDVTTVGFNPGPVPAGEWAAEIGVASVAGPEEGDPDGSVSWRLEVYWDHRAADLVDPYEPTAYDVTPARSEPGWYKGDLHVHARHSAPQDASMMEAFGYAFDEAGLDFITLSDYVGTRQWGSIGAYQAQYPDKLVIRSAEVITYRGHVNNHGSVTYVDHRTGPVYELGAGGLRLVRTAQPASRILSDIRAAGGLTQVNHPTTFPAKVPGFGSLCRGCSWEYPDAETDWSLVDAMEVQTGPAGTPDPRGNELGPNPFTPLAIRWWDELRARGYRVTAVGASDSHHAGRTPGGITQSPIGEATTVVYAQELSERGIADAVRKGHAYVKFFTPSGPDLRFSAEAETSRAIMGDRLAATTATFTARVMGAAPNPQPRTLHVMLEGVPILSVPVPTDDFVLPFTAAVPGNYRLQLQRGTAIEAITNPITLAPA
ncbi:MAG TPA: CehA/McbA family metallohydrolase [Actinomycetota bacterium]|nr:CehA/McbA family metallohydrolase [Actinomycetota bacterium]